MGCAVHIQPLPHEPPAHAPAVTRTQSVLYTTLNTARGRGRLHAKDGRPEIQHSTLAALCALRYTSLQPVQKRTELQQVASSTTTRPGGGCTGSAMRRYRHEAHLQTSRRPCRAAQCSAFRRRFSCRLPAPLADAATSTGTPSSSTRKRHTSRWPPPAAHSSALEPWRSSSSGSHPSTAIRRSAARSPSCAARNAGSSSVLQTPGAVAGAPPVAPSSAPAPCCAVLRCVGVHGREESGRMAMRDGQAARAVMWFSSQVRHAFGRAGGKGGYLCSGRRAARCRWAATWDAAAR